MPANNGDSAAGPVTPGAGSFIPPEAGFRVVSCLLTFHSQSLIGMATSLYIHIPFCTRKCNYCSFNSYSGLETLRERYVDALCIEMARLQVGSDLVPLKTVFLGGGTPTLLSTAQLTKLFGALLSRFQLADGAELSIEGNPGTLDIEKLQCLKELGVNRLSFGVQSFNDRELENIGRIHSAKEAQFAVEMAGRAGFSNISLDLMYALPGQTPASWWNSLETAVSLGGNHLSLYQLTVEEKTPLERILARGTRILPDEEQLAEMDKITEELTGQAGLKQYEISNYARRGSQCRHNIVYWENGEYFGVGAGAVSFLENRRCRNENDPVLYCELIGNGKTVTVESETLTWEESFRETVIMGLRMHCGVSIEVLEKRYGIDLEQYYGENLTRMINEGLLVLEDHVLHLTTRGGVFANQVMSELV